MGHRFVRRKRALLGSDVKFPDWKENMMTGEEKARRHDRCGTRLWRLIVPSTTSGRLRRGGRWCSARGRRAREIER
jgi:hypothetical protein